MGVNPRLVTRDSRLPQALAPAAACSRLASSSEKSITGRTSIEPNRADAHFVLDADFRIVSVNAAMERATGLSRDALLGRVMWEAFPGAVGSEFASRHVQYEKFYAGAQFVTRGHAFRTFDWAASARLVDGVLDATPTPNTLSMAAE